MVSISRQSKIKKKNVGTYATDVLFLVLLNFVIKLQNALVLIRINSDALYKTKFFNTLYQDFIDNSFIKNLRAA